MGSFYRNLVLPVCVMVAILSIAIGVAWSMQFRCTKIVNVDSAAYSDLRKGGRLFSSHIASPQHDDI